MKKHKTKEAYFDVTQDGFGNLLWLAASKWRRFVENALSPLDLTHPQILLLTCIDELTADGTDVTQAELARYANLDITMTSQIVRTLEQKGLIERRQQAGDARSKFPRLTRLGQQLINQAQPVLEEVDSTFFDCLRADTKKCLDILHKLNSN